ncbi:NUDIX domain-containing protein [Microbacterium sp. ASV81]|uniref:NUDIX domain-containing protein n=1 Tax=Microbacterium capsulatum TaxID=3041921 RepID=A0ABU0XCQ1_9MICO|nr:NUDIX domain-containing protein [Microbacterium sp. ASV81]MDQ4212888.1 NUDIX domain-containing protein [Microbacterium sp. ASV81]
MTIVPPPSGEPPPLTGPRNSGDVWVVAGTGERYWGRYGAAGLLVHDADRGVLLQHRVGWSHFGGTWALPGGALHDGESPRDGAIREAQEEAGVPHGSVRARFESVLDLEIWSYTTVVADVVVPFEPVISDPESLALEWVPADEVASRPLHPGFAEAWPMLHALLGVRPVVVVDAANVVGSVPDGWWKDRAGAAARLRDRLEAWAHAGTPASKLGLGATRWHPCVVLVVEGEARGIDDVPETAVGIRRAPGAGDDEIVRVAEERAAAGDRVLVVTSDRGLSARIAALSPTGEVETRPVHWMLDQLGQG